jgi:hypothetical protein
MAGPPVVIVFAVPLYPALVCVIISEGGLWYGTYRWCFLTCYIVSWVLE